MDAVHGYLARGAGIAGPAPGGQIAMAEAAPGWDNLPATDRRCAGHDDALCDAIFTADGDHVLAVRRLARAPERVDLVLQFCGQKMQTVVDLPGTRVYDLRRTCGIARDLMAREAPADLSDISVHLSADYGYDIETTRNIVPACLCAGPATPYVEQTP